MLYPRNGQCVSGLVTAEEEAEWQQDCEECNIRDCEIDIDADESAVYATIVTVPADEDISCWPLARFREYPAVSEDYSWDDWDFVGPHGDTGYREALMNGQSWPEQSYWVVGELRHVVFQTAFYQAFVLGDDPEHISWHTYHEIFSNRSSATPQTKQHAWDIITGGEHPTDIVEYPLQFTVNRWTGRYVGTVPPLYTKARLDVLVNIPDVEITHRELAGRQYTVEVRQAPKLPEYEADGCIVCGEQRLYAKNVCPCHEDTPAARKARQELAEKISQDMVAKYAIPRPQKLIGRINDTGTKLYGSDTVLRGEFAIEFVLVGE